MLRKSSAARNDVLRMAGLSFFLQAIEVQTELRVRLSAVDLEGYLGAGAIFLEDLVEWHQKRALPSTDHTRNCGLHIGSSGEVEFSTIEGVRAGQPDTCT